MSASSELEKAATNYAIEAVRLDKQNSKGMAITMYQKAIETLLKLVQLYPDYGLNQVYIQRAMAYQERIRAIQGVGGSFEPQATEDKPCEEKSPEQMEPHPSESGGKKASFDELILKEKPNVKWDEVVGLDIAKKAIKEAITIMRVILKEGTITAISM